MNKSEAIRSLGREGHSVVDIARRIGVRYQFARNVLLAAGLLKTGKASNQTGDRSTERSGPKRDGGSALNGRPQLTETVLSGAGFLQSSRWELLADGRLSLDRPLDRSPGVYAMVKNGTALYVGLATMGLASRFYFYARPGKTQRTSLRINALLKDELRTSARIDIYTVTPPAMEWAGLPINIAAGLELGLIESYFLPWNIRGVKR